MELVTLSPETFSRRKEPQVRRGEAMEAALWGGGLEGDGGASLSRGLCGLQRTRMMSTVPGLLS